MVTVPHHWRRLTRTCCTFFPSLEATHARLFLRTHTSTRRCQRWLHRSNVPGNASTPDYRIHLSMQVPTRDHWKTQGDTSHSLAFPCQSQLMTKRSAFLLVDQLWAAVSSDCTVPSALSGATSGMHARWQLQLNTATKAITKCKIITGAWSTLQTSGTSTPSAGHARCIEKQSLQQKIIKHPQEHASGRPGWTRSQKLLAVASSSKTQIKKHSTRFKM